jgi:hypothetical protein
MKRSFKDEKEKELRRLSTELNKLWKDRRTSGTWVDVPPYQKGWIRYYVLRDISKNNPDAHQLRQALDLVNSVKYCDREDFCWKGWRDNKLHPIEQRLGHITKEKFNSLPDRIKKYFRYHEWIEKMIYGHRNVNGYRIIDDYHFVFKVEPNIITQQWIPDGEVESRIKEIDNYFEKNNLIPKLNKIFGHRTKYKDLRLSPYLKNKFGHTLSDEDFDYDEEE